MAMAARWYIVHAHSGFEKKVSQEILKQAEQKNMKQFIHEICVPTESVTEVKKGKKTQGERKFFPGYVLVKMELNDETWHLVKSTPKVTGFLGGGNKPQPISDKEADQIFQQMKEGVVASAKELEFEVGEQVKVIDGPFDSFVGVIEGLDEARKKLKVAVSIFGRATPVELEFNQVEKVVA